MSTVTDDEDDIEIWKPEPGDTLTGVVVAMKLLDSKFGSKQPYPYLELKREDGTVIGWHASPTVARSQLKQVRAQLGDTLDIKYKGERGDRGYKAFAIKSDSKSSSTGQRSVPTMASEYGVAVFDKHADYLRVRGVSPEVAGERGYRSADTKAQLRSIGFGESQRIVPALIVPVHDVVSTNGECAGYQLRPDSPRMIDGRVVKFETPRGARLSLDVPPSIRVHLGNPAVPLWFTAGPVKADSAVSHGLACVALAGVYGWKAKNDFGGTSVLPQLEHVHLKSRQVYLAFDSDLLLKPQVHDALSRFYGVLRHRGADVAVVLLPVGENATKTGLDDYFARGGTVDELVTRHVTEGVPDIPGGRSKTTATVQPQPAEPPALARNPQILNVFQQAIRKRGVVGEETTACTLYLTLTSRVLDEQVSAAVKGPSGSGKSHTTEETVAFFPPEAVLEMTAMSEHALVYMEEDFGHRTLVLYEAVALREGQEDNHTSYFVRSLLSEGRIRYPVVMQGDDGKLVTQWVVKEGPTNLIVTTTKTQVHAENETRLLSFSTNDSREQTARILAELANEANDNGDLSEWRQLQSWLAGANHKVTIPYSRQLAEKVKPVAVRLRRDFGALLALIRSHAVLHQLSRDTDDRGRIVATVDDYRAVRELVAGVLAEGVGSTVSDTIRETIEAVEELTPHHKTGVPAAEVAKLLKLDKSAAWRRLTAANDRDYVENLEDRKGRPGRWVVGEPLPDDTELLPDPDQLGCTLQPVDTPTATTETVTAQEDSAGGCTVAAVSDPPLDDDDGPDYEVF